MKVVCFVALFGIGVSRCLGDASNNQPGPESPREALTCLIVPPGFKIELVASEPVIESPVAFEWGGDGKLWVVEMRDYPRGESPERNSANKDGKPGPAPSLSVRGTRTGHNGRIVFLEDSNHKGVYDKVTVFLDGLNYPNSVYPWRKGVMVSAGGEIYYAEASNGDGKADVHKTILSGFYPGNPQHRVNGFEYGLDNWMYAANGDSGGAIRSPPENKPMPMRECDLRFQPDSGAFELA
jgi:glucose/arabinose dehydrogenase